MNTSLFFDFSVDKEKNVVTVKREFAADLDMVWDAWTKVELLEQWWAPKPFRVKTKSMDFREGGTWLYAMVSPQNEQFWAKIEFLKIEKKKSYSALDAFTDEAGNVNPDFDQSQWNNVFTAGATSTTVTVTIQYKSLSTLEKVIQMGFKEGFTMALDQLDAYFATHTKTK